MQATCRYSGVQFFSEHFRSLLRVEHAVHPIFSLPSTSLIDLSSEWLAGKMDKRETRLYFLSLANSTGLLDWKAGCAARPTDKIIETNMEPLIRMVNWHASVRPDHFEFPMFAVTLDSRTMQNIYHWIDSIEDIKKDWKNNYKASRLRMELEAKEERLNKLINSHSRSVESYAGRVADWAITATRNNSVPLDQNTRDQEQRWKELFCLRGDEIYQANRLDLEDLYEYMETNLDVYGDQLYATITLRHLRKLVYLNAKGFSHALGMPADFQLVDFTIPAENARFAFLEDDNEDGNAVSAVEEHNRTVAAQMAPMSQPFAHQYASNIDFIRATARWNIQQKLAASKS